MYIVKLPTEDHIMCILLWVFVRIFETGSPIVYVVPSSAAEDGLELLSLTLLPFECWDSRWAPPRLAYSVFWKLPRLFLAAGPQMFI